MKPLTLILCLALLLSILPSPAFAADLPALLTMDEDSFLAWFCHFTPEAVHVWNSWRYDISLENGAELSGNLSDVNQEIESFSGRIDSTIEDAPYILEDILYVLPGVKETFPDAWSLIASDRPCGLPAGNMTLSTDGDGNFILDCFYPSPGTLLPSVPNLPELEALLENAGFPIESVNLHRVFTFRGGDFTSAVTVGEDCCISSVEFIYRGTDPQPGKDYFSAAAALLDEEAQTVVSTLIRDYYDVLEGSDYKSKAVSDYSLTLAGTYGMSFSVHMLASAAEMGAVLFPLDAAMPAFGSPCN